MEEKVYIGCKVIKAVEMTKKEFVNSTNKGFIISDDKGEDGYKVTYPDGYVSWSPKSVFENAYREVTQEEKDLIK